MDLSIRSAIVTELGVVVEDATCVIVSQIGRPVEGVEVRSFDLGTAS